LGPDIEVGSTAVPLRLARRAIDGRDVFLLINDSPDRWRGSVTFGLPARAGELLDPATGSIRPLPDSGNVGLDLDGWGAVILRLDGVARVPRLHPDRITFAPGAADRAPG
jgi:hypothetical protein